MVGDGPQRARPTAASRFRFDVTVATTAAEVTLLDKSGTTIGSAKGEPQRLITITVQAAANATSFTANDTTGIRVRTKLFDPVSKEQMLVATVPTSTTFTVETRGTFGTGTPRLIPAGTGFKQNKEQWLK